MGGVLGWLRRKDPQFRVVRRASRVTLVSCAAFYFARYVLDSPTIAPYALFGAFALGALSQIPGTPRQRAGTLIAVLPAGWLLVTLGTLLSVTNWSATAGMFVLGFVVSFVGVGGPRLVGLAAGMQLLYILPCFPPYDPGSLLDRLSGLTLSVVLLAIAELVLWPDPTPPTYRRRLADAVTSTAGCLTAVVDTWSGDPTGRARLAELVPAAADAAEQLRPFRMPPTLRPASAGRRDRALSSAAGTARLILGRTVDLSAADAHAALNLNAATDLLRETAGCTTAAGAWLRGEGPLPDTDRISAALTAFRVSRMNTDPNGVPAEALNLGSMALAVGEWAKSLVVAIRIAAGVRPEHDDPTPPEARPGAFWFAYRRTPYLYWHRLVENLTPRSVAFQGALRLAAALAAARLLAGELDLSHGFWVLLTILTVLRTSATETRSTLKPALVGTVAGSIAAALLLLSGLDPVVYIVALPVVLFGGFAAQQLLGLGWGQGLFTLGITLIFAQVTPVDWRIAETRVLDVLIGAGIGVLIGLFAWPRGGGGELYRATATFIAQGAEVIRETVAVMAMGARPGTALPRARMSGQLADASYALLQSEQHTSTELDWQATLISGHHAVRGAEVLIRSCPAGGLLPCVEPLTTVSSDVAERFERIAVALFQDDEDLARRPIPEPGPVVWPTDLGQNLYVVADLRVWLDSLREDIGRIAGLPEPADTLRTRVAQLADGAP
nr:FUSC family protein [uncultured Actinoplanes sp.]